MVMDQKELLKLKAAARNDNPLALAMWASQFETQISKELQEKYEKIYNKNISDSIDTFFLCIAYCLLFSEETIIKPENIPNFIDDVVASFNLFETGEYNPKDYAEEMKKAGLDFENHKFSKKYRITLEEEL